MQEWQNHAKIGSELSGINSWNEMRLGIGRDERKLMSSWDWIVYLW